MYPIDAGGILVVYGAGHAAILRHLVQSDPDLELVDAREHLPRPA